ncbi:MAG: hypothetical protein WB777_14185 [Mycobacterium sp.]
MTPNGTHCYAENPYRFDERLDITEGVQALYDLVINSMDWGSGFLSYEDALPVSVIAHACGFGDADRVDAYLADKLEANRKDALRREFAAKTQAQQAEYLATHEHVLNNYGRCIIPGCGAGLDRPHWSNVIVASEPGVVRLVEKRKDE